jgi:hypothetical protein
MEVKIKVSSIHCCFLSSIKVKCKFKEIKNKEKINFWMLFLELRKLEQKKKLIEIKRLKLY